MNTNAMSIVLVGGGNMGGAMAGGWISNGVAPESITLVDPILPDAMAGLVDTYNIRHETSAEDLDPPDVLVIAVKPQIMEQVLVSVKHLAGPETVVISVAAGKTLAFMEEHLGSRKLVRALPNTPSLVRRGITVACAGPEVSQKQINHATRLFESTGSIEWIDDEALMDAVTAVSGSGPAYVFHLVEAMTEAAVSVGLPDELAGKLALETVAGAGELMMRSDQTPTRLRENVTSPGGTTQAALNILMGEGGFNDLMLRAITAAEQRGKELS
jgi:pyrroline-5-carboxylate reductase